MVIWERPHSTFLLQTIPALQCFPFCLPSYQNVETIMYKALPSRPVVFWASCQRKWSHSCREKWQSLLSLPSLVMSWHTLLSESVVSSWKSLWAPLEQVSVPAEFLEHSKPQTPIPLTHISNLEDCSTITRKTAPKTQELPCSPWGSFFIKRSL